MAAAKILHAVIMGAPGSGKGTIAKRIVTDFDMKFLSSGDVLRNEMMNKTAIGKECEKYVRNGELVPDDIMDGMILTALHDIHTDSWLLDGFPRTWVQAVALHKAEKTLPDIVIDLIVPFDVIIERVKGRWIHEPSGRVYNTNFNRPKVPGKDDITGEPLVQRIDDKEETVLARLQSYQRQTVPIAEFYEKKGIIHKFEGRESNEIWPKVRSFLTTIRRPVHHSTYK